MIMEVEPHKENSEELCRYLKSQLHSGWENPIMCTISFHDTKVELCIIQLWAATGG